MTSHSSTKAGCLAVLACGLAVATAQTPAPVQHLDPKQFAIPWFEIARYPDSPEKHCVGDATILYAAGDKPFHLQIVSACNLKGGASQVRNLNARAQQKTWNGMLQVTSWPFFLFSRKYWVLAVDPGYAWALVGTPNRKELWILSKTPTMDNGVLAQVKSTATANGFDVGRLVMVASSGDHPTSVAQVTSGP